MKAKNIKYKIKPKPILFDRQGTNVNRQKCIYNFLSKHPSAVIASIDQSNNPHASVIYINVDNDLNISFLTKNNSHKYKNLKNNNHVMIVVYDLQSQMVAQIIGLAKEIKNADNINKIISKMLNSSFIKSSTSNLAVNELSLADISAFRVVPDEIRMACYDQPLSESDDLNFLESVQSFDLQF